MPSAALKYEVMLESTWCSTCGVHFALPDWLLRQCRESGRAFYCPVGGHSLSFTDSELVKAKRELQAQKDSAMSLRTRLADETYARQQAEKKLTQTETRARAGVCLDCHRRFKDVARHRAMKHGTEHDRAAAIEEERAAHILGTKGDANG